MRLICINVFLVMILVDEPRIVLDDDFLFFGCILFADMSHPSGDIFHNSENIVPQYWVQEFFSSSENMYSLSLAQ